MVLLGDRFLPELPVLLGLGPADPVPAGGQRGASIAGGEGATHRVAGAQLVVEGQGVALDRLHHGVAVLGDHRLQHLAQGHVAAIVHRFGHRQRGLRPLRPGQAGAKQPASGGEALRVIAAEVQLSLPEPLLVEEQAQPEVGPRIGQGRLEAVEGPGDVPDLLGQGALHQRSLLRVQRVVGELLAEPLELMPAQAGPADALEQQVGPQRLGDGREGLGAHPRHVVQRPVELGELQAGEVLELGQLEFERRLVVDQRLGAGGEGPRSLGVHLQHRGVVRQIVHREGA